MHRSRVPNPPEYYTTLAGAAAKALKAFSLAQPVLHADPQCSALIASGPNAAYESGSTTPNADYVVAPEDSPAHNMYYWTAKCAFPITITETLVAENLWAISMQALKSAYGNNVKILKPREEEKSKYFKKSGEEATGELTLSLCTIYEPAVFLKMLKDNPDYIAKYIDKACERLSDIEHEKGERIKTFKFWR